MIAKDWATTLVVRSEFRHSRLSYGENLYEIRHGKATSAHVVAPWASEAADRRAATTPRSSGATPARWAEACPSATTARSGSASTARPATTWDNAPTERHRHARNLEIKARVGDLNLLRAAVLRVATSGPQMLAQRDTFYHTAKGRLKLREFADSSAELIYYERPDQRGPKKSTYTRTPVPDPASMRELLERLHGARAVVCKQREVFLVDNTRIHLDQVDGLGSFVEFEVVLGPDETESEGEQLAAGLMKRLGIQGEDLIEDAYVDLLPAPPRQCPS